MTTINQDTARSVVKSIGDDSRENIIERAKKLRAEISQTFAEAERWNRVNVPWKGPAIDPDPDGQLKRIADGIDRMLASESPNTKIEGRAAFCASRSNDELAVEDSKCR